MYIVATGSYIIKGNYIHFVVVVVFPAKHEKKQADILEFNFFCFCLENKMCM